MTYNISFFRGNTISMAYSNLDRIEKFGDGIYLYNSNGLVVQNAREENFHYNAKGLLVSIIIRGINTHELST
jgi:hypothetical protein